MKSISYYFHNPFKIIASLTLRFKCFIPDKLFLKIEFRNRLGYSLNLDNPQAFSEKIQWLKLYNRKPEYTIMVDKVKAKEYVARIIGDKYIIPNIGVWSDPDDIEFDKLPERFVLKCNHNSGTGMYICKDKSLINVESVKAELRKGLKENYFIMNREWPYKNVPRRIFAEQFVDPTPGSTDLTDYKWYCFNGEPKYCQVIQNRSSNETIDFFDTEWKHQDFIGLNPDASGPSSNFPKQPNNLELHISIAKKLSKNMPFARIDLYESGEKTYFGEITLFPQSGFGMFKPEKYNKILGDMITLPSRS